MAGTHRNQCRCGSMGQKAQSLALASAPAGRSLFLRLCSSSFSQEWWEMTCRTPSLVHAAVLFYFKVTDVCVLFQRKIWSTVDFVVVVVVPCCFPSSSCWFWSNPLTPPFGGMNYFSLTDSKMEVLMEYLARHWQKKHASGKAPKPRQLPPNCLEASPYIFSWFWFTLSGFTLCSCPSNLAQNFPWSSSRM